MRPQELVLAALLCFFIVADIPLPRFMLSFFGTVPGIVVLLGTVFYVFTQSPTLGVLAFIAGYVVVQRSGLLDNGYERINLKSMNMPTMPSVNMNGTVFTPASQFPETLEESVVNNLVPLVRDTEGPFFNVAGSGGTSGAAVV